MTPRRSAVSVATWLPAFVLLACIAAGALAGVLGQRRLLRAADTHLLVAGEFAANHVSWLLASRVRALENTALLDAQVTEPGARAGLRARLIAGLLDRHPELLWAGFADQPGRVSIASRGVLVGGDVSARPWWRAGLRGPFLGEVHEMTVLAPLLGAAGASPPRLIDIAVPLREGVAAPYGVLAAHIDAHWVIRIREELDAIVAPLDGIEILVLQRDGSTVVGPAFQPDSALPDRMDAGGLRTSGRVDGVPRVVTVHSVSGDVVVDRLGWRVLMARDPRVHDGAGRGLLADALAAGSGVGVVAALWVAALLRRARLRSRPAP